IFSLPLVIWLMISQRLDRKATLSTAVQQVVQQRPRTLLSDHKHLREGTVSCHTHVLHRVGGSCLFPTSCDFENGLVTRFLSARAKLKISSTWAQRGWKGNAASLKDLARHAWSLAAKNVTLAADRYFHLNEVV